MEGDRERDRRSRGWTGNEWPDGDWEREQAPAPERRPRIEDRGERKGGGRYEPGGDLDSGLPNVMDDPLYGARPGQRGATAGGRQQDRLSGRRARPSLSWGQKLLLWVGFAVASGVSFGVGLVVGASGGIDVPGLAFLKPQSEEVADPASLEALGPTPDAEGMIEIGERGTVPSEIDAPPPQPPAPKADKGSGGAGETKVAKAGKKAEAEAPAPAPKPAAATAAVSAPEADAGEEEVAAEDTEAPPDDPAAEMTFYETATGKRAAPGLTETDEEAPRPAETEAPAPEAPPARLASEGTGTAQAEAEAPGAPAGADLLQRRRAIDAAPEPAAAPQEAPSGAALLARRQAGGSPASAPAARASETYTVQVSTLADRNEAESLAARLNGKGFDARVVPLARDGMVTLYRVRVGQYASEAAARGDLDRLQNEPGTHPYIRME